MALEKIVGGRLANKASIISGIGECNAFITATIISYCLQNKRVFTTFCQNLKGNSEKGDIVFEKTRQNTTGHRTTAKKKGGHNRTPLWRHLRTLIPYLLFLLKTNGLNDSDERNSFIVPKTINLHK